MVLLYFSDTGTTIGKWHQPGNPACKGFWACVYHNKRYPTHWMPLPEAPNVKVTDAPSQFQAEMEAIDREILQRDFKADMERRADETANVAIEEPEQAQLANGPAGMEGSAS